MVVFLPDRLQGLPWVKERHCRYPGLLQKDEFITSAHESPAISPCYEAAK